MILDTSALLYIQNNNAKDILLQYRFKTEWQRIYLELCILSGFSFCVLEGNDGFIMCLDDFKDCYIIFAATLEDIQAGLERIKLAASPDPTHKIFMNSLEEYAPIVQKIINKFGYETTITVMEHWGAKKITDCPFDVDTLKELSIGVEIADLSSVDQICKLWTYNPSGNISREDYISHLVKKFPVSCIFDEDRNLIAFSGLHSDGKMGLTNVIPSKRNMKLAPKLLADIFKLNKRKEKSKKIKRKMKRKMKAKNESENKIVK